MSSLGRQAGATGRSARLPRAKYPGRWSCPVAQEENPTEKRLLTWLEVFLHQEIGNKYCKYDGKFRAKC